MTSPRKPRKRFRVDVSSTTKTYYFCWMAAKYALERAQGAVAAGGFPHLVDRMTAGVFAAFTVEAYLNHLAERQVPDWQKIERTLSPKDKLQHLSKALNFTADESRRPYQTFHAMLALRDALAHGKTRAVRVSVVVKDPRTLSGRETMPTWRKLCDLPSVERMVADAEAIIRLLAPLDVRPGLPPPDPFDQHSYGRTTTTELDDEEE